MRMRGIIVIASCIVCFFKPISFAQPGKDALRIGDDPPPLQLSKIIQGPPLGEVSWDKLKGKVVVVEFWDTGCGPCRQAIPHLNELVDQFNRRSVVFLSISDDNADYLRGFLQRRPIKGCLALDGPFTPTKAAFGVNSIPITFIVDESGKIAAITRPASLKAEHLEEVLAGKPCSLPALKPDPTSDVEPAPVTTNPPPTKVEVSIEGPFPQPNGAFDFRNWDKSHTSFKAEKAYLRDALVEFYGGSPKLVFGEINLPQGLYDISAAGPRDKMAELRARFIETLRTNLGVVVHSSSREVDVYAMTVGTTNAVGLRSRTRPGGGGGIAGGFMSSGGSMDSIASFLENSVDKPVINETKLSGRWAVDLKWEMSDAELLLSRLDPGIRELLDADPDLIRSGNLPKGLRDAISTSDLEMLKAELAKPSDQQFQPDPAKVIKAAHEQLGLELKPAKREMSVIEIEAGR
jgi:uncharacterized protein (TIGR03435 family)